MGADREKSPGLIEPHSRPAWCCHTVRGVVIQLTFLDLRAAHRALDRAIDRLYRRQVFGSELERAEHLLGLYETAAAALIGRPRRSGRR